MEARYEALSVPNFRRFFFFLINDRLERSLYVKLKDWMLNSVDYDESSHLDLCYLQKSIIIVYGGERVLLEKFKHKAS